MDLLVGASDFSGFRRRKFKPWWSQYLHLRRTGPLLHGQPHREQRLSADDTARFQLSALSSETFEQNECVVYPNPSKGTIYLEHPGIGNGLVEFQLTDVRGLVIMSGKVHDMWESLS